MVLSTHIILQMHAGDLGASASLIAERETISRAIGRRHVPYGSLARAAWQGHETETVELMEATAEEAAARGEGVGLTIVAWTGAVLHNGLGRYGDAIEAVRDRETQTDVMGPSSGVLVELVEAAAGSGRPELAVAALDRLAERTTAAGTDWALGIEARSRALVSEGDDAERSVPRGDRPARPHAHPGPSRARPSGLRRVAPPCEAPRGGSGRAPHRPRDADVDGPRGVRGAGEAGAGGRR